jgi:hypothetical protein
MPIEVPTAFTATGPNVAVVDPGGAPVTIIRTVDQFRLRVTWALEGSAALLLGGNWLLRAYAESIGPGQEQQLGSTVPVPLSAGTITTTPAGLPRLAFDQEIIISPPHLQAEGPGSSGVYKLVTILTHENFAGPTVLAGFNEGPVIQMREP